MEHGNYRGIIRDGDRSALPAMAGYMHAWPRPSPILFLWPIVWVGEDATQNARLLKARNAQ